MKSGSVTCSLFNRSPHPGNYVDTNKELLVMECLEGKIPSEMEVAPRYIYADYTVDMVYTVDIVFTVDLVNTVDTDYTIQTACTA